MKKTIFRLCFLLTILSTLWCCRNEEFSTEDSSQQHSYNSSARFTSKSWGSIELKKISSTQISWEYRPNDIILDDSKCPLGTDIKIYLPETKDLIFTKQ